MNTHADKTPENKNQTVANRLPEQQSSGGSTFQFADNRPAAIAQAKLQEVVNNSPRVQQLKAFQEMADNFTVPTAQQKENNTSLPNQRKADIEVLPGMRMEHGADAKVAGVMTPADKSVFSFPGSEPVSMPEIMQLKLIVAGEEHGKLDKLLEVEFAKEKLEAENVIYENDFKVGEEFGDPKDLRRLQCLTFIDQKTERIESAWNRLVGISTGKGRQSKAAKEKAAAGAIQTIDDHLIWIYEEVENQLAAGFGDDKEEENLWVSFFKACDKLINVWLSTKNEWKASSNDPGEPRRISNPRIRNFGQTLQMLKENLSLIKQANNNIGALNVKDIALERSRAMHNAANQGAEQSVVWKIGQKHVRDIMATAEKKDRNYELMSQLRYEVAFREWLKGWKSGVSFLRK